MNDIPIFDIGIVDDGATPDRDFQRVRRQDDLKKRNEKRRGLVFAAMVIALAIGALLVVPVLGSDQDEAALEPIEATPSPDPGESARASASGSESESESDMTPAASDVGAGISANPPTASHLRADEVASLFANDIDIDLVTYGVAYLANGDFTVLDHRGITVPDLLIAQDFATVSGQTGLVLLTSGGRTWAIDARNRDNSYLVSNSYVVVESQMPGTIAIINPKNPRVVGLMASALPVPGIELPDGAELLWVQGRGLLVLPRTGGTFEVTGIASSLVRISDDRAVEASLGGTIYERCDEALSCRYIFERGTLLQDLPFDEDTTFSLSPDGNWVVAMADGVSTLHSLGSDGDVVLTEGVVSAIDWAPDSSFLVAVRGDMLETVHPSDGRMVTMQLNAVPDDASLLVFASDDR